MPALIPLPQADAKISLSIATETKGKYFISLFGEPIKRKKNLQISYIRGNQKYCSIKHIKVFCFVFRSTGWQNKLKMSSTLLRNYLLKVSHHHRHTPREGNQTSQTPKLHIIKLYKKYMRGDKLLFFLLLAEMFIWAAFSFSGFKLINHY